jgi:two-component system, NtrC family, sensor kinase
MRVRAKVTLLLALLFAVLIGAQWAIQQRLLLPRFEELERASARTDMQRVQLAVERELQSLGAAASDWGNWADTWQYMLRPNPQYERSNLTDTAVRTLKVDYLALVASDGHFVWARAIDPLSGEHTEIQFNHTDHLELAWQHALERGTPVSGLVDTNAGVLLASGAPILDGFNHGPSRGMVVIGRLFDRAEQLRIGNQAQVALEMSRWRGSAEAAAALPLGMQLAATPDSITVRQVLSDLSGRPLLTLGISVPRTVSARGAQAVRYSTLSVSVAAAIVLAALLWLIGRIVLGPLGTVTDHAARIAAADDLSARLNSGRRDELGTLASSIDNMVERLAQSRRELIDRSFESGAAENAAGVLHELGNAMTPLIVHADALGQLMGIMPIDEVRRGIDELFVDAPDAQRQQDLRQYLKLLAAELARSHERAGDSLRQLLEQAQAIQASLAVQRRQPRAGAVMQTMTPAELVTRGLERLTAFQRSRLEVELSAGLAALGAMSLPCTTLAMVLQKLAQYAADAAARAGLPRTRLRVGADGPSAEAGSTLHLRIESEAGGVGPQELPGLFDKPPSMDSPVAGVGYDLHWCANTLHALGGGISAHSAGPASGIRFDIRLPLGGVDDQSAERAA